MEQVLGKVALSGQEAKASVSCNGWPEACPAADGAVAPIRTLREIEVGFERDGATVATAVVCIQHASVPMAKGSETSQPAAPLPSDWLGGTNNIIAP